MSKEIGYIQFDGVKGSATEDKHKDWSKIYSVGNGVTRPRGGNSAGVINDRADVGEVNVTLELDKAAPPLFQKSCEGKIIPKVVIELTSSTGKHEVYLKHELENVRLVQYQEASHLTGDSVESRVHVAMSFTKIKTEFTSMDDKGSGGGKANGSWDVKAAKA